MPKDESLENQDYMQDTLRGEKYTWQLRRDIEDEIVRIRDTVWEDAPDLQKIEMTGSHLSVLVMAHQLIHSQRQTINEMKADMRIQEKSLDGYSTLIDHHLDHHNRLDDILDKNAALREVLEDIMECPYAIDQATVPKAGFEANVDQIVGVMSMSLWKYRKAKELLPETEEE